MCTQEETSGDELLLGFYGAVTCISNTFLATVVAADLDFRKLREPELQTRFGPPIIDVPQRHPDLKVRFHLGDDNCRPALGVLTAINFTLGLDGGRTVAGIIGGLFSSSSVPVASLLGALKVPQISYGATSPALSSKVQYPYFLRTIASDTLQASVMVRLMIELDIPAVTVVYQQDAYGSGLDKAIKSKAARYSRELANRISSVGVEYMSNEYDLEKGRLAVDLFLNIGSKFMIICQTEDQIRFFLPILHERTVLDGGRLMPNLGLQEGKIGLQVIGSEAFQLTTINSHLMPVGSLKLLPVHRGPKFADFAKMWRGMTANDVIGPNASSFYGIDRLTVSLDEGLVPKLDDSAFDDPEKLPMENSFLFDAAYTFINAANELLKAGKRMSEIRGETLLNEVKRTTFEGISGEVAFDEQGDRVGQYTVQNYRPDMNHSNTLKFITIATYNPHTSTFTWTADVLWMDGHVGRQASAFFSYCLPGHALDSISGICRKCPVQTSSEGGSSVCKICNAGSYTKTDGSSSCSLCQAGRYHEPLDEKDPCKLCSAGKISERGSSSCFSCNSGEYAFSGDARCKACPTGEVANEHADGCRLSLIFYFLFAGTSVLLFLAFLLLPMSAGLFLVPIDDLTFVPAEGSTRLTTSGSHYMIQTRPSCEVVFLMTRHPKLESSVRYRAKILNAHTLEILAWDGSPLPEEIETSSGFIRTKFPESILVSGFPGTPFLFSVVVFALLLAASLCSFDSGAERMPISMTIVICVTSFLAVLAHIIGFRLRRDRPRIRKNQGQYRAALRLKNPEPVSCAKGPSRAITEGQLSQLHEAFSHFIRDRNMYYVDSDIIRPLTKLDQLSFAELAGPSSVEWYVSHYWGTSFKHFVQALHHHANRMHGSTYWVCCFSNNQWSVTEELGHNWDDSSFYLTLKSGLCKGVAMVLDPLALPLTRSWCLFEILQTFLLTRDDEHFVGLLMCTGSGVLNFGCPGAVDASMAIASQLSKLDLENAEATKVRDKQMIIGCVESMPGGFEAVNLFVRTVFRQALHQMKHRFDDDFAQVDSMLEKSKFLHDAANIASSSSSSPPGDEDNEMMCRFKAWGEKGDILKVLSKIVGSDRVEHRRELLRMASAVKPPVHYCSI